MARRRDVENRLELSTFLLGNISGTGCTSRSDGSANEEGDVMMLLKDIALGNDNITLYDAPLSGVQVDSLLTVFVKAMQLHPMLRKVDTDDRSTPCGDTALGWHFTTAKEQVLFQLLTRIRILLCPHTSPTDAAGCGTALTRSVVEWQRNFFSLLVDAVLPAHPVPAWKRVIRQLLRKDLDQTRTCDGSSGTVMILHSAINELYDAIGSIEQILDAAESTAIVDITARADATAVEVENYLSCVKSKVLALRSFDGFVLPNLMSSHLFQGWTLLQYVVASTAPLSHAVTRCSNSEIARHLRAAVVEILSFFVDSVCCSLSQCCPRGENAVHVAAATLHSQALRYFCRQHRVVESVDLSFSSMAAVNESGEQPIDVLLRNLSLAKDWRKRISSMDLEGIITTMLGFDGRHLFISNATHNRKCIYEGVVRHTDDAISTAVLRSAIGLNNLSQSSPADKMLLLSSCIKRQRSKAFAVLLPAVITELRIFSVQQFIPLENTVPGRLRQKELGRIAVADLLLSDFLLCQHIVSLYSSGSTILRDDATILQQRLLHLRQNGLDNLFSEQSRKSSVQQQALNVTDDIKVRAALCTAAHLYIAIVFADVEAVYCTLEAALRATPRYLLQHLVLGSSCVVDDPIDGVGDTVSGEEKNLHVAMQRSFQRNLTAFLETDLFVADRNACAGAWDATSLLCFACQYSRPRVVKFLLMIAFKVPDVSPIQFLRHIPTSRNTIGLEYDTQMAIQYVPALVACVVRGNDECLKAIRDVLGNARFAHLCLHAPASAIQGDSISPTSVYCLLLQAIRSKFLETEVRRLLDPCRGGSASALNDHQMSAQRRRNRIQDLHAYIECVKTILAAASLMMQQLDQLHAKHFQASTVQSHTAPFAAALPVRHSIYAPQRAAVNEIALNKCKRQLSSIASEIVCILNEAGLKDASTVAHLVEAPQQEVEAFCSSPFEEKLPSSVAEQSAESDICLHQQEWSDIVAHLCSSNTKITLRLLSRDAVRVVLRKDMIRLAFSVTTLLNAIDFILHTASATVSSEDTRLHIDVDEDQMQKIQDDFKAAVSQRPQRLESFHWDNLVQMLKGVSRSTKRFEQFCRRLRAPQHWLCSVPVYTALRSPLKFSPVDSGYVDGHHTSLLDAVGDLCRVVSAALLSGDENIAVVLPRSGGTNREQQKVPGYQLNLIRKHEQRLVELLLLLHRWTRRVLFDIELLEGKLLMPMHMSLPVGQKLNFDKNAAANVTLSWWQWCIMKQLLKERDQEIFALSCCRVQRKETMMLLPNLLVPLLDAGECDALSVEAKQQGREKHPIKHEVLDLLESLICALIDNTQTFRMDVPSLLDHLLAVCSLGMFRAAKRIINCYAMHIRVLSRCNKLPRAMDHHGIIDAVSIPLSGGPCSEVDGDTIDLHILTSSPTHASLMRCVHVATSHPLETALPKALIQLTEKLLMGQREDAIADRSTTTRAFVVNPLHFAAMFGNEDFVKQFCEIFPNFPLRFDGVLSVIAAYRTYNLLPAMIKSSLSYENSPLVALYPHDLLFEELQRRSHVRQRSAFGLQRSRAEGAVAGKYFHLFYPYAKLWRSTASYAASLFLLDRGIASNGSDRAANVVYPYVIAQEKEPSDSTMPSFLLMDGSAVTVNSFIRDKRLLARALPAPLPAGKAFFGTGHSLLHEATAADRKKDDFDAASLTKMLLAVASTKSIKCAFALNIEGCTPMYNAIQCNQFDLARQLIDGWIVGSEAKPVRLQDAYWRSSSCCSNESETAAGMDLRESVLAAASTAAKSLQESYLLPVASIKFIAGDRNVTGSDDLMIPSVAASQVDNLTALLSIHLQCIEILWRHIKKWSKGHANAAVEMVQSPAGAQLDAVIRARQILSILGIPLSSLTASLDSVASNTSAPSPASEDNGRLASRLFTKLTPRKLRQLLSRMSVLRLKHTLSGWFRHHSRSSSVIDENLFLMQTISLSITAVGASGVDLDAYCKRSSVRSIVIERRKRGTEAWNQNTSHRYQRPWLPPKSNNERVKGFDNAAFLKYAAENELRREQRYGSIENRNTGNIALSTPPTMKSDVEIETLVRGLTSNGKIFREMLHLSHLLLDFGKHVHAACCLLPMTTAMPANVLGLPQTPPSSSAEHPLDYIDSMITTAKKEHAEFQHLFYGALRPQIVSAGMAQSLPLQRANGIRSRIQICDFLRSDELSLFFSIEDGVSKKFSELRALIVEGLASILLDLNCYQMVEFLCYKPVMQQALAHSSPANGRMAETSAVPDQFLHETATTDRLGQLWLRSREQLKNRIQSASGAVLMRITDPALGYSMLLDKLQQIHVHDILLLDADPFFKCTLAFWSQYRARIALLIDSCNANVAQRSPAFDKLTADLLSTSIQAVTVHALAPTENRNFLITSREEELMKQSFIAPHLLAGKKAVNMLLAKHEAVPRKGDGGVYQKAEDMISDLQAAYCTAETLFSLVAAVIGLVRSCACESEETNFSTYRSRHMYANDVHQRVHCAKQRHPLIRLCISELLSAVADAEGTSNVRQRRELQRSRQRCCDALLKLETMNDPPDSTGISPIAAAAICGDFEILNQLLESVANESMPALVEDNTFLLWHVLLQYDPTAVGKSHAACAVLLQRHGFAVTSPTHNNTITCLDIAILKGMWEVVGTLLQQQNYRQSSVSLLLFFLHGEDENSVALAKELLRCYTFTDAIAEADVLHLVSLFQSIAQCTHCTTMLQWSNRFDVNMHAQLRDHQLVHFQRTLHSSLRSTPVLRRALRSKRQATSQHPIEAHLFAILDKENIAATDSENVPSCSLIAASIFSGADDLVDQVFQIFAAHLLIRRTAESGTDNWQDELIVQRDCGEEGAVHSKSVGLIHHLLLWALEFDTPSIYHHLQRLYQIESCDDLSMPGTVFVDSLSRSLSILDAAVYFHSNIYIKAMLLHQRSGESESNALKVPIATALRALMRGSLHEDTLLLLLRTAIEGIKKHTAGDKQIIEQLLHATDEFSGIDADHRWNEDESLAGETILHLCARRGYANIVSYLLQLGASPSTVDSFGLTPLTCSIAAGHGSVTRAIRPHCSTTIHRSVSTIIYAMRKLLLLRRRVGVKAFVDCVRKIRSDKAAAQKGLQAEQVSGEAPVDEEGFRTYIYSDY